MEHVVLVIHLMLALAITGLVLLQRSEGGGLGMGGGGMGGFATPQATANALTKATAVCAACFFATSLILGMMANANNSGSSILDKVEETVPAAAGAPAAPAAPGAITNEAGEVVDKEAIMKAVKEQMNKMEDGKPSGETETPQEPKVPISE